MKAKEIATTAGELVGGQRAQQHGDMLANFTTIADYWNTYLRSRAGEKPLDALDVAQMMTLLKIARSQTGALNLDNFVDGAGYQACGGEIAVRLTNG